MPSYEQHILRILSDVQEPLYASEIAELLDREVGPTGAYTAADVVRHLQALGDQVVQLREGGWRLKRLRG